MRSFRIEAAPRWQPVKEKLDLDLERSRALAKTAWDKGEALAAQGDVGGGLVWVGRAHRIAPADQNILFSLAWLHLRAGDAHGAASLFGDLARRHATPETYNGWIAALLGAGRVDLASGALQDALATNATDSALARLAARVVAQGGHPGWCGLGDTGLLLTDAPASALRVTLDGTAMSLQNAAPGAFRLRGRTSQAGRIDVRVGDMPLLGSPLAPDRVFRLEGFVERGPKAVTGWAWHPGAPSRDPRLTITNETGRVLARLTPSVLSSDITSITPLARPRNFSRRIPDGMILRVLGPDGSDLLGSPIAPTDLSPPAAKRRRRISLERPVDVVIPIYRGLQTTLDCIASVLETVGPDTRLWAVNDSSPDPALVAALEAMAAKGSIRLIASGEGARNRGFPTAANAGLRAAAGRHVVLLNSDTLVSPGWLDGLRDAACSAADIGTATPISNEASILSYPADAGENPALDLAETRHLAKLAAKANRGRLVEIPTAHGFCMFIRRDCLDQTGLFDETLFAQGYGEENDFSERARALGWRHVAVPEIYVTHLGGVSFAPGREHLLQRNLRLLEQRHPGYHQRIADWIEADPLANARRRLDVARWQEGRPGASAPWTPAGGIVACDDPGPAISGRQGEEVAGVWGLRPQRGPGAEPLAFLLVTHGGRGGTTRVVRERAAFLRAAGYRPVILRAVDGFCEIGDGQGVFPNLRFALPREFAALRRFLAASRPVGGEVHHLLGHDHGVMDLFAALGIPYDIWVHDYAWFCARLSFITGEGRFCGEAEVAVCENCVSRWGNEIGEDIAPGTLRQRSAADLRGARAVIVPSEDVARRVARHVPGLKPVVTPWEVDRPPTMSRPRPDRAMRRVVVVGAIGVDKGFDVLLACAKDAAARRLPIEFVVVGYTVEDEALLETGKVFITGEFTGAEASVLIQAQAADLAFIPSIWPETWCYALSDAWAGGLPAVAFDIGTPPARIRAAAGGWVLPLGLPASRVNDVLLSLAKLNTAKPLSHAI